MQSGSDHSDHMADADAALAQLAAEYPAYAAADVAAMRQALADGDAAALHGIAHNVKGQGASFGYDLLTRLGEALCAVFRANPVLTSAHLAHVGALVEACDRVLSERLTGAGGAEGLALAATLGLEEPA